jgi:hypothetical protein
MSKARVRAVGSVVRVKAYEVIRRAVEEGVRYGWSRAHKHDEKPDPDVLREALENAVVNELCEWLIFDEPEDG